MTSRGVPGVVAGETALQKNSITETPEPLFALAAAALDSEMSPVVLMVKLTSIHVNTNKIRSLSF